MKKKTSSKVYRQCFDTCDVYLWHESQTEAQIFSQQLHPSTLPHSFRFLQGTSFKRKFLYFFESDVVINSIYVTHCPSFLISLMVNGYLFSPVNSNLYSCNNITTTLVQISRLFYFGFFSKTNLQKRWWSWKLESF